jgi:hypothetical protein
MEQPPAKQRNSNSSARGAPLRELAPTELPSTARPASCTEMKKPHLTASTTVGAITSTESTTSIGNRPKTREPCRLEPLDAISLRCLERSQCVVNGCRCEHQNN